MQLQFVLLMYELISYYYEVKTMKFRCYELNFTKIMITLMQLCIYLMYIYSLLGIYTSTYLFTYRVFIQLICQFIQDKTNESSYYRVLNNCF